MIMKHNTHIWKRNDEFGMVLLNTNQRTESENDDIDKYRYKRLVGLIAHTALTVDLIGVVSTSIVMLVCRYWIQFTLLYQYHECIWRLLHTTACYRVGCLLRIGKDHGRIYSLGLGVMGPNPDNKTSDPPTPSKKGGKFLDLSLRLLLPWYLIPVCYVP